ncbi:hypothetical protein AMET1_0771 [Methanonatronarchaeum thermophilum]|uniref:Uncharacterized protein n=1 Tax=Methanonatronarchaeum thermophilum TaxID=1927129 RepID=A0A1Y3GCJ5_9EURY|nr:hypothetical protein AMET1_0771 [Methanonatronarchaeum thermophilum]
MNKKTVKITLYLTILLFLLLGTTISILIDNINSFLIGVIGVGILVSLYRVIIWQHEQTKNNKKTYRK